MDDRQAFSTEQQQQHQFIGKQCGPLKTKGSHREKRKELYCLLSFLIEMTLGGFPKMSFFELGLYPCELGLPASSISGFFEWTLQCLH